VFGLYRPDGSAPFPAAELPIARALHGETTEEVELLVRNDRVAAGLIVSVSARPLLTPDGRVDGAVAVLRDVTRSFRAERELEQKTVFVELLKQIAVAANEARSLEEAFQRALDTICATIGWPFGQVYLVKGGADPILLPPTIRHAPTTTAGARAHVRRPTIGWPIQMVLSTRRAMWIFDVSPAAGDVRPADGPRGGPAAFAFPVLAGDEPVAVMEFWADRAMEPDERLLEVMANVGTQLGRAVERHRSQERLESMANALARSNEELEQFAYAASHDLREPLRTIAGHLKVLAEHTESDLDPEDRKSLDHSREATGRMQRLIDGLLAYARVSTQGHPFVPAAMDRVLEHALQNLDAALVDAGATVTADPLPTVFGDEVQLTQLLQNLIANAVKFRGDAPPVVRVTAQPNEGEWIFSVEDNGIGIPPEQQDRIFRLFQRLHTQRERPGTGIGLAMCRRIVERHGGRIWIESRPGEGSTFRFSLPMPREELS
jgi:signal transduction histidine kinase